MTSGPHIEIINHPTSPAHKLVKAITRGRVYAVTYAEPFPYSQNIRTCLSTGGYAPSYRCTSTCVLASHHGDSPAI
jgi:hypothetical protein